MKTRLQVAGKHKNVDLLFVEAGEHVDLSDRIPIDLFETMEEFVPKWVSRSTFFTIYKQLIRKDLLNHGVKELSQFLRINARGMSPPTLRRILQKLLRLIADPPELALQEIEEEQLDVDLSRYHFLGMPIGDGAQYDGDVELVVQEHVIVAHLVF